MKTGADILQFASEQQALPLMTYPLAEPLVGDIEPSKFVEDTSIFIY